jgi:hypothetical protein
MILLSSASWVNRYSHQLLALIPHSESSISEELSPIASADFLQRVAEELDQDFIRF